MSDEYDVVPGPILVDEGDARRHQRSNSPFNRFRRAVMGLLLRASLTPAVWVCGVLSPAGIVRLGRSVGMLMWRGGRNPRRARAHLAMAFPELSEAERESIVRRCAQSQAIALLEGLQILARGAGRILERVEVEGWETIAELRRKGQPFVIMSAHFGNWELIPAILLERGIQLYGFAREVRTPFMQKPVERFRERVGLKVILRGTSNAAYRFREAIRGKHPIAMLIDQDTRVESDWVPFFRRMAYTPLGAARIALKYHRVVVPMFVERREDGRYVARIDRPLDIPRDPVEATAIMTRAVEAAVRRCPEQWVWHHKRWRTRPPDERAAPAQA